MRAKSIKPILIAALALLIGCGNGNDLVGDAVADQTSDTTDVVEDSVEVPPDTVVDPEMDEPDTVGWECVTDEDCDDSEPCTSDACDTDTHACLATTITGLAVMGPRVQVTDNPEYSRFSDLVWTGSDVAVVWSDGRDGPCPGAPGPTLCNYEVYFKRLTLDGDELTSDVRVSHTDLPCIARELVWTGSEFGVAWECGNNFSQDIYFRRVGVDGTPLGDQTVVASYEYSNGLSNLVWTGSEYVIAWEVHETKLARIGNDGSVIDATIAFPVTWGPAMVWTGSELILAWRGGASSDERSLQIVRVSPEGLLTGVFASMGSCNAIPRNIAWTGSDIWVSYTDIGDPGGSIEDPLYLARVTESGEVTGDTEPFLPDTRWGTDLFWTGSEVDVVWSDGDGWESWHVLGRVGHDGTRLAPDFNVPWGIPQAWTGEEYVLADDDEVDGVSQVFIDRLGFCE